jgi:hypothetical protein
MENELIDELLKRASEKREYRNQAVPMLRAHSAEGLVDDMAAVLKALRAQEPVEWKVESRTGRMRRLSSQVAAQAHEAEGFKVTPLYAAPVPAQEDVADRVENICHAYESGVGHRGRPTANVNPYPRGSDEYAAYALGAKGAGNE